MSTTVTGSTIALPSLTEEDIQRELQLRDGLAGGAPYEHPTNAALWRALGDDSPYRTADGGTCGPDGYVLTGPRPAGIYKRLAAAIASIHGRAVCSDDFGPSSGARACRDLRGYVSTYDGPYDPPLAQVAWDSPGSIFGRRRWRVAVGQQWQILSLTVWSADPESDDSTTFTGDWPWADALDVLIGARVRDAFAVLGARKWGVGSLWAPAAWIVTDGGRAPEFGWVEHTFAGADGAAVLEEDHWGRAYWRAGSDPSIVGALAEQGMRIARGRARTEAR